MLADKDTKVMDEIKGKADLPNESRQKRKCFKQQGGH